MFVCGLHRSGTSPFSLAIKAHPDVGGLPREGQFLQSVYPTAKEHGGPGRFGFDARAHLTEDSPLVTEENRARLLSEWGQHWDVTKSVLVEKSPPNLLKLRFLQALFPTATLVAIVRNPAAVTLATERQWKGASMSYLVEHWLACHRLFMDDAPHVDRLITVRYEDLIGDPELFPQILAALGLHPTTGLPGAAKEGLNESYFEQWRPDDELRELIAIRFELEANRFGYSLVEPTREVAPAPDFERLLTEWRGVADAQPGG